MGDLRGSARTFILIVTVVAGGLLTLQWRWDGWPVQTYELLTLALLALASILADIWGIRLHLRGVAYTVSTAVNFALVLLFGPLVAAPVGAIASATADLWARRVWYKTVFNSAVAVIVVSVAGFVYVALNDGSTVPLATPANSLAVVVSGFVYVGIEGLLICTVVGLVQGYGPWGVYQASLRSFHLQMITLIPIGMLIAVVYHQNPVALLLLLFPIALTNSSYQAYERLRMDAQRTMETLAEAVDRRDHYTYRHSERVAQFCDEIARRLKLDLETADTLVAAARVHDLGKIGIDSSVLLKPGKLDAREWEIMKEHPRIGADIIASLPMYEHVRELVACHQERYDGKGYPGGLAGEKIPLGARIIAVADAYEAMTSDRPYRKALSQQVAIAELCKGRGTQFDPRVVDAFLVALEAEEAAAQGAAEKQERELAAITLEKIPNEQAAS